jgi:hypothetical protein
MVAVYNNRTLMWLGLLVPHTTRKSSPAKPIKAPVSLPINSCFPEPLRLITSTTRHRIAARKCPVGNASDRASRQQLLIVMPSISRIESMV